MIDIKVEYNFVKSVAVYRHFFEKEVKGSNFWKIVRGYFNFT
jgi:hypothetical protein